MSNTDKMGAAACWTRQANLMRIIWLEQRDTVYINSWLRQTSSFCFPEQRIFAMNDTGPEVRFSPEEATVSCVAKDYLCIVDRVNCSLQKIKSELVSKILNLKRDFIFIYM